MIRHNKLRRASWHNYRSPSFYLITISKRESPEVPLLSNVITKENGVIATDFSWSGWTIYNAIQKFKDEFSFVRMGNYVIMPDHIHMIIQITEETPEPLGFYINKFKGIATQSFRSKSQVRMPSGESVFEDGFNDRILMHKNQLDIWSNYVKDNPRRLWLMKNNPDYFRRSYTLKKVCPSYLWNFKHDFNNYEMLPHKFPTFGNAQLLRYPEKIAVRFSREYSKQEWEKKKEMILRVAKNGGVLVSPAIHEEERRIVNEGIMLGARIIKVIGYGFPQREKPQGEDFFHCSEGRMLLLALFQYEPGINRDNIYRIFCERMNACAQWITETEF